MLHRLEELLIISGSRGFRCDCEWDQVWVQVAEPEPGPELRSPGAPVQISEAEPTPKPEPAHVTELEPKPELGSAQLCRVPEPEPGTAREPAPVSVQYAEPGPEPELTFDRTKIPL